MFTVDYEGERYSVNCIVNRRRPRVRRFVIDTGAKFTCCSYDYIDPELKEEDFADTESKLLGGFVADVGMKFYKCELTQFTIGTVDCGAQSIWITFDPRIADCLLGMDILHSTCFLNNPDEMCLEIYSDMRDLAEELSKRI